MIWNNELEQSALSCLMIDPNCLANASDLSPDDFASDDNREIYQAAVRLAANGKNVDYLTIYEETRSGDRVKLDYLLRIGQHLPSTANYDTYVGQLKDLTQRRKLYYLADEIKRSALDGDDDVMERAEKGIFGLRDAGVIKQENIVQIVTEAMQMIESRIENPGLMGMSSGFKEIDTFTDGFKPTDYIVLGARPSMGKSALAYNIAQRCGGKVDIYSLETSQHAVYKRMIMAEADISAMKIRSSNLKDMEKVAMLTRLWEATKTLYGGRVRVIDGRPTISEIKAQSRRRKMREGLDLIVIDYMQQVKGEGKSRYEQVTNISMEIREMIMELRVPVLALAQMNREAGAKKIPELRELKESGQIEQDADCIMLLHREDYYDITQNQTPTNEGEVDLIFAKQRDNPIGTIKLGFIKNCTKFVDIDEIYKGRSVQGKGYHERK